MNKYRNIPTIIDGVKFASRKEARRYQQLKLLERAGAISELELQPKYDLTINGVKIGRYIGDFRYQDNGKSICEDCKGILTPVYRLKKRLMRALHGVEILET